MTPEKESPLEAGFPHRPVFAGDVLSHRVVRRDVKIASSCSTLHFQGIVVKLRPVDLRSVVCLACDQNNNKTLTLDRLRGAFQLHN